MIHFQNPDFSQLIHTIQTTVQGLADIQKLGSAKLQTTLSETISELQDTSQDPRENSHFAFKAKHLLENTSLRPSLGPSLIYGSHSSPLLRFIPALQALKNRSSVVFLCHSSMYETYVRLFSLLVQKGLPEKSVTVISTQDAESLETLISHPSLKAIHFDGHFYEGAFLKNISLPLFKKRIRIHLGGRNPVIFTHDAPLEMIKELLTLAIEDNYLTEHSFNRWFVQEKNYAEVTQYIEQVLPQLKAKKSAFGASYEQAVKNQNQSLLKEKNWKLGDVNFNPDFNNCSAWQQQEVLGPALTVTRFKNTAEAVKFANTTQYASAGCVFSGSLEKSMEIANQLSMPHRFPQIVPDMGSLPVISGLSETGFGQTIADKDFFIY